MFSLIQHGELSVIVKKIVKIIRQIILLVPRVSVARLC
jgi:hypothetical protein